MDGIWSIEANLESSDSMHAEHTLPVRACTSSLCSCVVGHMYRYLITGFMLFRINCNI